MRAIRLSLRDKENFRAQLRGILQASGEGDVRLLLPFVTGVEEVREAKAVLLEAMDELREAGKPFREDIPVGVMIETPAAVWIADLLALEVDFFSIGTNDLIQYALAVDRGNDDVAYLYRPSSPAVLRMLDAICTAAARNDVHVVVCGEMAADPFHVPLLIGLGIRSLSMSAQSIPLVKRLVRRVSAADCQALVRKILDLPTADEVEREVAKSVKSWESTLGRQGSPRPPQATRER
jgi:phosphotransferase system enzyme I (PtsI)